MKTYYKNINNDFFVKCIYKHPSFPRGNAHVAFAHIGMAIYQLR